MLETIKKAMNNDNDAFNELILIIHDDLLKIAYLNLSNNDNVYDALQETLIIAYNNITKLRVAKYFKTWIIKILINECYKINDRDKKYINIEEEVVDNIKDETINIKANLENDDFFTILNRLDEKYRIIIYLFYGEELKIREIAKILNLSSNTVKTRLRRGKVILKNIYEKEHNHG